MTINNVGNIYAQNGDGIVGYSKALASGYLFDGTGNNANKVQYSGSVGGTASASTIINNSGRIVVYNSNYEGIDGRSYVNAYGSGTGGVAVDFRVHHQQWRRQQHRHARKQRARHLCVRPQRTRVAGCGWHCERDNHRRQQRRDLHLRLVLARHQREFVCLRERLSHRGARGDRERDHLGEQLVRRSTRTAAVRPASMPTRMLTRGV